MSLTTLVAVGLLSQGAPQTPPEDYAATWQKIDQAIRGNYYARTTREKEMNALLEKYGRMASTAANRSTFASVVNEMIEAFKDSHFAYYTTDDQGYYLMDGLAQGREKADMAHIGAFFRKTSDGYTVQMVLNGTEAEKQGLRKGDLVVSIDGQPFTPVASLRDRVDKDATLEIRRGKTTVTTKVHVAKDPLLDVFLEASRNSRKVLEVNGRQIGYFHLWTQAGENFKTALANAVYGPLSKTDAFILDLRDGFGGRPEGYADPFFRPDVVVEWKTSPTQGVKQLFGYQRPLIVLINEGSRSAKEVLSYILKKSGRATLVGSRTAGHVLGTTPRRINSWSYLEIPMVDVYADGDRLEINGVKPHVEVKTEMDDKGNDLVIAEALKRLANVPKYKGVN